MDAVPSDQPQTLLLSSSFRINEPNRLRSQNISSSFSNKESDYITANTTPVAPHEYTINTANELSGLPTPYAASCQQSGSVYVTAKTSALGNNSQISANTTTPQSSSHENMLIHTFDPNKESIDPLQMYGFPDVYELNQIQHAPLFTPSYNTYSGFGKPTLRQSIISRQSSRILPPNNRIVDYMEEQMVRWRPPSSSFHAEEILSGKHPFQQNNVPILEIQQALVNSNTDNSTSNNTTTDSLINSISRSPFITEPSGQAPILSRHHKIRATFSEHNNSTDEVPKIAVVSKLDGKTDEDKEDKNSIQESIQFHSNVQDLNSASASSSIIHVLRQEQSKELVLENSQESQEPTSKPATIIFSPDQLMLNNIDSARTIEAQPLQEQDIELLIKDQPQLITEQIFSQNERDPIQEYSRDEESERGCWAEFTDAWADMITDCVDLFTCNFNPDPNHIYS